MLSDTIAAVSTSLLAASAINIVRISGPEAFEVLGKIFRCRQKQWEGYRIYYGTIVEPDSGNSVDEVLVSIFRAPHSYTGEDMAEINCHGGLYVTRRIYGLCLEAGARPAINGEFTKRAFLNGKIDLTQAEAVNDLINADGRSNARLAMNNLKGSVRKLLEPLMDDVMQIIAHIEVNIDYPEYDDVGVLTTAEIRPLLDDWLVRCNKILQAGESSLIIKEGVRTVIVGKPNVGKSSLLNALLAEDKAIVTEIAGTTRDLVEGDIHLQNVTLHLIDTAGIHDTENMIEKIGIEKSRKALEEAQLVILVLDGSKPLDEEDNELLEATEGKNRIVVYNKSDLNEHEDQLSISAVNNDIEALVAEINRRFRDNEIVLEQPSLSNERQLALMREARESMLSVRQQLDDGVPLDLVNEDLQNCYRCLKEILGEYSREDLLDGIFSRFCLGK
ncbi:MAG: tRNA uridine-5-carboxymethylaminomethyl(34) synthesis GTPase MnmE [Erysipelotrichaceae bacterium]|nr:tRNA uridine-5-carboxymethylaminomethyl(34) synthesis GTPase MnmE [Erysipelotrichaceae bacterium]